ncbi:TOMM precursor leader peptide-binding protein [Aquirufa sp. Wall-65K1]
MKTTIPHQAIFCGPDSLFILDGDQNLIEINGESSSLIKEILKEISQEHSLKSIFEIHQDQFENDNASFQELIDWMLDKQLIQQSAQIQKIKIHVLIDSFPTNQSAYLIDSLNQVNENQIEYIQEDSLKNADLILFVGSLLNQRKKIQQLAQLSYETKIPLLYSEIDRSSFTIGPIISSDLLSPCLNCFADRKQVMLKNPKAFSSLQKAQNHEYIFKPSLKHKLYYAAFVNFLGREIQKFFYSNLSNSPLLGQSYYVNGQSLEIQKSKILKVPHCTICCKKNQSMTFNN